MCWQQLIQAIQSFYLYIFFVYGSRHIGCRFLLWWILNVARARCRVEFLSASNRPKFFVLVPPLISYSNKMPKTWPFLRYRPSTHLKKIYENKTLPIQASMVWWFRKSFLNRRFRSRMYLINFIAQVCFFSFWNTMTGCFWKMLKVTLSKA